MDLRGLRVLITGAAGGAGASIAQCFSKAGAYVHIADIDARAVKALAAGPERFPPASATAATPKRLISFSRRLPALNGLDVLVNNVGIAGPAAAAEDVTPEDWDRTIAVNLSGFFYCVRKAIPLLKQAGGGSILNVSSTSARTGLPHRLPYAVSKVGVMGLTETLARELGPFNIRVNTILPGWINNARANFILERKAKELGVDPKALMAEELQFISMRTQIEPEEIAEMMMFLCSKGARHVSASISALRQCGI